MLFLAPDAYVDASGLSKMRPTRSAVLGNYELSPYQCKDLYVCICIARLQFNFLSCGNPQPEAIHGPVCSQNPGPALCTVCSLVNWEMTHS